jgi:hypothetical protein
MKETGMTIPSVGTTEKGDDETATHHMATNIAGIEIVTVIVIDETGIGTGTETETETTATVIVAMTASEIRQPARRLGPKHLVRWALAVLLPACWEFWLKLPSEIDKRHFLKTLLPSHDMT